MVQASRPAQQSGQGGGQAPSRPQADSRDLIAHLTEYAEQNPSTAALWCFGLGFVIGWKLKPW